jgi:hypothetical protein
MRAIFINQNTSWSTLSPQLVPASADPAQVLAQLQRLNPHVDFARIADGAVILLPDNAATLASASKSVGGDSFSALAVQLGAALKDVAADVQGAHDDHLAQQKETLGLLKLAMKRIGGDDPDLAQLAQAAVDATKDSAARAKEASASLAALQQMAEEELTALARRLGGGAPRPAPTRATRRS